MSTNDFNSIEIRAFLPGGKESLTYTVLNYQSDQFESGVDIHAKLVNALSEIKIDTLPLSESELSSLSSWTSDTFGLEEYKQLASLSDGTDSMRKIEPQMNPMVDTIFIGGHSYVE